MTSTPDDALPQDSDSEASHSPASSLPNRKTRRPKYPRSPLASDTELPYRRGQASASLSNLFASTTSLPGTAPSGRSDSGTVTPQDTATANGSSFSPAGSTIRSPSPSQSQQGGVSSGGDQEIRNLVLRAFSPHVSVLASQDTEELVRHKGIHGGLLELLRPFGETVQGKVTIRDSVGASKSWEDYSVRFVGVKDGLENPRPAGNRNSLDAPTAVSNGQSTASPIQEYKPARLRTGGDIPQIEELVERHLTFAEEQSSPFQDADYIPSPSNDRTSPFYLLYLRRLLSGLPLVPAETFSHPIASVIAISSRSASPIEDLRTLYASSNTGDDRLPHWVHNEFLRYYLLIHDEDYDDLQKSAQLYEQMKRHFGLHCHLLRLRSKPCSAPASPPSGSSDDEGQEPVRLPLPSSLSAAEELAEITRHATSEDDDLDLLTPYIFSSDATNIRAFVREMVTQSIVPSMERASANWNDAVASRRRGISGRFMSLSKRWTGFGGTATATSRTTSAAAAGSNNYDISQGFYRPDAAEATMRRLADYSMLLRDYRLAKSTYEILTTDFKNDKAWRHYAAANEMFALSSLIITTAPGAREKKSQESGVDSSIDSAYYSYTTRVSAVYPALRTCLLNMEMLLLRGYCDEAAKWGLRVLEDRLVGPVGHVLVMERLATIYVSPQKKRGGLERRKRKSAFWSFSSCEAWLRLEKSRRAEQALAQAEESYSSLQFENMSDWMTQLRMQVNARSGKGHLDEEDLLLAEQEDRIEVVETLQDHPALVRRPSLPVGGVMPMATHRKSVSVALPPLQTGFDPLRGAYADTPTTLPAAARPRAISAASSTSNAASIATNLSVGGLHTHVEEMPALPSPSMTRSSIGGVERKDPRDEGFE